MIISIETHLSSTHNSWNCLSITNKTTILAGSIIKDSCMILMWNITYHFTSSIDENELEEDPDNLSQDQLDIQIGIIF